MWDRTSRTFFVIYRSTYSLNVAQIFYMTNISKLHHIQFGEAKLDYFLNLRDTSSVQIYERKFLSSITPLTFPLSHFSPFSAIISLNYFSLLFDIEWICTHLAPRENDYSTSAALIQVPYTSDVSRRSKSGWRAGRRLKVTTGTTIWYKTSLQGCSRTSLHPTSLCFGYQRYLGLINGDWLLILKFFV